MSFELPPLPYEMDALEPRISKETLEFHYGKHHRGYFDKLNDQVAGTEDENATLEELIEKSQGSLFNNAAQAWNHSFYWNSMSPSGGGSPTGPLAKLIDGSFGSFDGFKKQFTEAALSNFGSGWTWLVAQNASTLSILNTSNADTPVRTPGITPLFTCDVWEHAYYIDFRNARAKYLDAFWELINWDFAESNMVTVLKP